MEKQKILLVDDSPSLLKLGKAIFETGGYDVITVMDGVEALEVFSRHAIALVITDILMPNMDGYSLCYHIRNDEHTKSIPVIIYSATYTSQSDEKLAIETGANMFIRKPATMDFLLEAAGNLISKTGTKSYGNVQQHQLTDVMQQYSTRLVEKLEQKNTELEKTHEALSRNEEKYRLLFENNPMPMWVFDLETFKFLDVNETACIHYGYSRKEFLSLSALDIRPDGQKESFRNADHSIHYPKGSSNRGVWKHQKKDGTLIDVEVFAHTISFGGKEARLILANDVTKQKVAEEQLASSERRFRALVENSFDTISMLDEKGNIIYYSPAAQRMLGYTLDEAIGMPGTHFFHPDDIPDMRNRLGEALKNPGKPIFRSNRMKHKDGHYIWTEGTTTNFLYDPNVKAFVGNFREITERKLAEEKIIHLNRLYAFISAINQTIVHVTDEQSLYRDACRIAVEIGKFRMAWIGIADKKTRVIKMVEGRGMQPEDAGLFTRPYDNNGPQDRALSTGAYYVCNDIENSLETVSWKPYAATWGLVSCMVMPIRKSGQVVGTLNLYSSELNLFDGQEILLLEEVAGDISFALDVFEKEKLRIKAEEKLKHNELRFNQAQAIAHIGSWELEFSSGVATWSDEHCRIYGLLPQDNVVSFQSWMSMIHPEDREYALRVTREGQDSLKDFSFHHRIVRQDGEVREIYSQNLFELGSDGKPKFLFGASHDITEQKEAEQKITKANRLYQFISQINQTIVHATDEQTVFKEACRIAMDVGKFKVAWIGKIDGDNNLCMAQQCGIKDADLSKFESVPSENVASVRHILNAGSYFLCNDIERDYVLDGWDTFSKGNGLKAAMVLPIWKNGKIYATFNLYSVEKNFFNHQEIALLQEAAGDISFALDIFEKERLRKETEDKILHSELRLRQAQAIAHLGSWELDFATGLVVWSEENCRIFGLQPEDNIHSYEIFLSFIHPEDLDHVKKTTKEAERTLSNIAFHHRILLKDGTVKYIYSLSHVEFNGDGRPVGLYGVTYDETEIKEAEQEIEQSEANLRLILDLLPQSVFVKDANADFIFVNKNFAKLYGKNPADLVKKTIIETIPVKSEAGSFIDQDLEVIRTGKSKIIPEHNFTDYEGNKLVLHTIKVPFTVPGTNEKAVLGIASDITELKQLETEKAKITADILQRNRDLEQFSYIVSHNLRAPVANIIGLAEVVNLPGIEPDEVKEFMGRLSVSAQKLDGVVIDLNYILQLRDSTHLHKESVNFYSLLGEITQSIDHVISMKNVTIRCDFSQADEIFTFKSYMYSIFINIISNSIKFMQPGIAPVIEISSCMKEGRLNIIFKDNGMGIDLKKRADQVFGLYKRFHPHVEGKGMGLYIVKTQVQVLGDTIGIKSEVNKGSEFTVEFSIN